MKRYRKPALGLAAAGLVAALAACENTTDVVGRKTPSGGPEFLSYVALGNSITAGWQSGGISDSTQRESYAVYLARQMGLEVSTTDTRNESGNFIYPGFLAPNGTISGGCPSPIANFQSQKRVDSAFAQRPLTGCYLRAAAPAIINNVAVPGATVVDPTSTAGNATSSTINQLILGGRSQVSRALMARPTFASIWIGNNDVLAAGVSGVLSPVPGVSPGMTPTATFTAAYDAMMKQLTDSAPGLKGVLIGVVQVKNAPILFPAAALQNPAFKAGFDQYAGGTTTVLANCTNSTSLISFQIVTVLRTLPTAQKVISCDKSTATSSNGLLGELFVLDAQDQAAITARVNEYNAYIQAKATALNFAYFDPNPALDQLKTSGAVPAVPNLASTTAPFGEYISLDGVHPRRKAHKLVANGLITVINAKYNRTLPLITDLQ